MMYHKVVSHWLVLNPIKVVWDPLEPLTNPNLLAWELTAHSSVMILDHLAMFQHSQQEDIAPTEELKVDPIMVLALVHITHTKANTPTGVVVDRPP